MTVGCQPKLVATRGVDSFEQRVVHCWHNELQLSTFDLAQERFQGTKRRLFADEQQLAEQSPLVEADDDEEKVAQQNRACRGCDSFRLPSHLIVLIVRENILGRIISHFNYSIRIICSE